MMAAIFMVTAMMAATVFFERMLLMGVINTALIISILVFDSIHIILHTIAMFH